MRGGAREARQVGWGTALKPAFEPVVLGRKPFPGSVAQNVLAHGTGALNIHDSRIGSEGGTRSERIEGEKPHAVYGDYGATRPVDLGAGRWPANVAADEAVGRQIGDGARFFYSAKASAAERPSADGVEHPTVKPLGLMQWLVRLVTPKGGTVLEPFAGSGTTVEACLREGFSCIAIEREAEYLPLTAARVRKPHPQALFDLDAS